MHRTLTALVTLAATAVVAGCGAGVPAAGAVPTSADRAPVATAPPGPTDVVMIIRHGEKPDGTEPGVDADGNDDDSSLTALGWQRAHALVGLFDPATGDPRPGLARPATIYAAGVTDEGEGQRTRETVAPLADALGLPVHTEYGKGDERKLVDDLLTRPGPTLVSWQHSEIPAIVDEFDSVSPKPPKDWPSDRFDVVWTLTRTADGWRFGQTPELVLPQDSADVVER